MYPVKTYHARVALSLKNGPHHVLSYGSMPSRMYSSTRVTYRNAIVPP